MCEPAHSVVQYPDRSDDDHDLPFGGMPMEQRLKSTLGEKVVALGKRIKGWFHFSKIGSGHTDAIKLSGKSSLILPEHTRYEGIWWEREFKLDGKFRGPSIDKQLALEVASQYHQESVGNSMSKFRQFFERSILTSTRPHLYVDSFLNRCLNAKGRDEVYKKLKRIFGMSVFARRNHAEKKEATSLIMGYTRKRELFLPHWADDDKLWTPG
jgi:hypothetical protein